MNHDEKLVKNVVDEMERLNSQLKDLETYKSDFSNEEYENLKIESVDKLIFNKQLLEKMQTGDLTTTTALENAKKVYLNKLENQ